MEPRALLKSRMKAARRRGALWVRFLDLVRLLATPERRSILWTRIVHGREIHQTTAFTCEDRYPQLFDLAATLAPEAKRILSFGCSTGEELAALRRRFPDAEIVGVEINPRSRRIAMRLVANDPRISVQPRQPEGTFDVVFALAVLQREPHKIADMQVTDLSPYYPFERFDSAVRSLTASLEPGGLLCVANAHYRIEDSSVARKVEAIAASPRMEDPVFGPAGRRLDHPVSHTVFRKRL